MAEQMDTNDKRRRRTRGRRHAADAGGQPAGGQQERRAVYDGARGRADGYDDGENLRVSNPKRDEAADREALFSARAAAQVSPEKEFEPDPDTEPVIKARVLSFREGLRSFDKVYMVRICSDRFNILILKDYMPVFGEIRGSVEIVSAEAPRAVFRDVDGFFIHRDNEFELLITEDQYVE